MDERDIMAVTVGVAGYDKEPYWYEDAGGNRTGFMRPILDWVCQRASLDCREVPIPELELMVPAVKNGSLDMVVHTLSVSEDRAKEVEFVHPFFYSIGVALYANLDMVELLGAMGWEGLRGEIICLKKGYFAIGKLQNEYGITPLLVDSSNAAVEAVQAGNCTAFAFDAGSLGIDLPQVVSVAPVMTAPCAIPVAKDNLRLRRRLSAALVEMMQDGNSSPILDWEKTYLTDEGIPSNPELLTVVHAISYFKSAMS